MLIDNKKEQIKSVYTGKQTKKRIIPVSKATVNTYPTKNISEYPVQHLCWKFSLLVTLYTSTQFR